MAGGVYGCMKVVWMGGGCDKGLWKCMEGQRVKGLVAGCVYGDQGLCESANLCGINMYI